MDSFQKLTMCDSRFGEKTKFVSWFRLLLSASDTLGAVIHPAFLLLEGHSCGTSLHGPQDSKSLRNSPLASGQTLRVSPRQLLTTTPTLLDLSDVEAC